MARKMKTMDGNHAAAHASVDQGMVDDVGIARIPLDAPAFHLARVGDLGPGVETFQQAGQRGAQHLRHACQGGQRWGDAKILHLAEPASGLSSGRGRLLEAEAQIQPALLQSL